MRLTAPDLKQPYSHQFNAGVSHEINRYFSIDADYIHALGRREIARWQLNTSQNQSTRLSPVGVFNPDWGRISTEGNRGHSTIDGFFLTGKVRKGAMQIITTYSLTKGMNIANDFGSNPGDPSNINDGVDWGPMPNDIRHRFTLGGVFQLPKGINFSTSVQANSGKPYNPIVGYGGNRNAVRPIDQSTGLMYGRNSFRGPGFFTWDARIAKQFNFGNARAIEVLFEMFNVTNRVNFSGDAGAGLFNSTWGTGITPSSNFGKATGIVPNSQFQSEFGVRFKF
jgi:hypothetical protein